MWTRDLASLALRLVFGGLMLLEHGLGKAQRLFGPDPIKFLDPFGIGAEASLALATFAELVCAGLLVLGVATRLASIPLIVTMAVAAFVAHAGDPLGDREPALLYLAGFIALFCLGGGRWSAQAPLARLLPRTGAAGFLLQ